MLMEKTARTREKRVLIFPAQAKSVEGKQIYFLFSLSQMEDVLTATDIREVPFTPKHVEGITDWRGYIVPVVSLEELLGLDALNSYFEEQRLAVIRSAQNESSKADETRCMIRISRTMHMLTLPIECSPADNSLSCNKEYIRGIYEWKEGILVVLNMAKILNGKVTMVDGYVQ